MPLDTIVYIDGYNLYYGLLRKSDFKWLDVFQLFDEQILNRSSAKVIEVRYYTAPILGSMCDDSESPQRQRQYLQALKRMYPEKVVIIEGKMIQFKPYRRPIDKSLGVDFVQVQDFEEKKTDVSIAVDMLSDACSKRCTQMVLCTNDSDQEPTLKALKQFHPDMKLGLVSPIKKHDRYPSKDLAQYVDWQKNIQEHHLLSAQLPEKIPHTSIRKPLKW